MVAVKMGGMMPPMGGMPQPMNMMPPPMPVPPMGQPMMPPQPMPMQQGAAPVAPQARSNAGRRKRFGDSLESMLSSGRQPVASDQMAGMNVFTGQMPRRPMPRGQMMGGTAMQPPVRRMMGGGPVSVPRETDIYGQPHMLAYINPEEADLLQGLGGMGTPGPGGVPQYNWFTDFISNITGGGSSSSSSSRSGQDNNPNAGDGGGMETILNDGRSSIGSAASKNANQVYADSMKAGGGGTNLSGSGSSAMADLVAAQQAQTQNDNRSSSYFGDITPPAFDISVSPGDDRPPPDITGSFPSPPSYGIPGNTEGGGSYFDDITPPSTPPNTGVVGGGYDTIGGGSEDDVGIGGPPSTGGGGSYFEDITPPINDVGGGGDGSYFEDVTLPITGGGDDTDTGINLTPPEPPVTYYDIEGNPHSTQAGAAEANRLINQRKADSLAAQEASFAQSALQSYAEMSLSCSQKNANTRMLNVILGILVVIKLWKMIPDYKDSWRSNVMTNYLPDDPAMKV
jgi:hypothetical protein